MGTGGGGRLSPLTAPKPNQSGKIMFNNRHQTDTQKAQKIDENNIVKLNKYFIFDENSYNSTLNQKQLQNKQSNDCVHLSSKE